MAFFDPDRPSYRANPYPSLARLRGEDPVHWSPRLRAWVCTRYVDCSAVLHDSRRFTTDPTRTAGPRAEAIAAHRAAMPLGTIPHLGTASGDAHRRLRTIVNPVFAPRTVARGADAVARLVEQLLEHVPAGAPFDLMTSFANPLPKQVMVATMGFPPADADRLQRLLATIELARSNPRAGPGIVTEAQNAVAEMTEFIASNLDAGLDKETVLGALTTARKEPGALGVDEIVSMAAHISTVGSDPTSGAIANAVAALAAHRETMSALRADPARVGRAVHEFLRYDSPTHIVARFAAEDTTLGGRRLRRGDSVLAVVGAANRDPAAFAAPDELDLDRDARRQLAFGQGEHICLGAPLALVILERALAGLFERFAQIELVAPPEYGASVEFRIPDRLLVRAS